MTKQEEPSMAVEEIDFSSIKLYSGMMGLIVGVFIQISTLGANFLALTVMGEGLDAKSQKELVLYSLAWSLFTSAIALTMLVFLRNLTCMAYYIHADREEQSFDTVLDELLKHLEGRYVMGALVGVSLAWVMTDLLLGMTTPLLYSTAWFLVSIVIYWGNNMFCCSNMNYDDDVSEGLKDPLLESC